MLEERRQRRITVGRRELLQFSHQLRLAQMQRLPDVAEHDLRRLPVEAEAATGRQVREPFCDLPFERTTRRPGQRTQPQIEAELPALLADEVQHGATRLRGQPPQPAADLLEEHRRGLGRTQQQDRVDLWTSTPSVSTSTPKTTRNSPAASRPSVCLRSSDSVSPVMAAAATPAALNRCAI
jgi:hypothetical protein